LSKNQQDSAIIQFYAFETTKAAPEKTIGMEKEEEEERLLHQQMASK
jgi:hypothetical protein